MIKILVHIETPTDSITDEYELSAAEEIEWQAMTSSQRDDWVSEVAYAVFSNACSYGTEVVKS